MGIFKKPKLGWPLSNLDIRALQDFIDTMMYKVFGNVEFGDLDDKLQTMIKTIPIPIIDSGNLDAAHPLEIPFFIPDKSGVASASLNIVTSKYRIDSWITISGGSTTSSTHSSEALTSDIAEQFPDEAWTFSVDFQDWKLYLYPDEGSANPVTYSILRHWINHKHVTATTDHHHDNPDHEHELKMEIKDSDTDPAGIKIYINDTQVGNQMSGNNVDQNGIDIKSQIKVGQWNKVKITCTAPSRVSVYGTANITV